MTLEAAHLAIERVERRVQPCGDVPLPLHHLGVEGLRLSLDGGDGPGSVVLALLDAVLLGDGAGVELSDRLVLEEVAAADLAVPLVRPSVARLQADDVRETPLTWPGRGSWEQQANGTKQTAAAAAAAAAVDRTIERWWRVSLKWRI